LRLYFSLNEYLKNKFNSKVWKIPVDAGFTCPNLDGTKGIGGCTYCNNESFVHVDSTSISEQVKSRILRLRKKKINKFIVYFQSYSNTYGDLDLIKEKINAALIDEDIVGIHIGTRSDVIDEEKLSYFKNLSKNYDLFLELGLQSIHNKTLEKINRGHDFGNYQSAVKMCKDFGIKICAHVILGLPGETKEDMLETVQYLSAADIESVKFHHLHIVKNTILATEYMGNSFKLLTEEEYIDILSDALCILDKNTIIARLVGDAPSDLKIAPDWPKSKVEFLNRLQKYMKENGLFQGKNHKSS
jgi:radical SAM protein (TIGR01212 family)